jgi:hypothetical protein
MALMASQARHGARLGVLALPAATVAALQSRLAAFQRTVAITVAMLAPPDHGGAGG